jgi:hypothetical protein
MGHAVGVCSRGGLGFYGAQMNNPREDGPALIAVLILLPFAVWMWAKLLWNEWRGYEISGDGTRKRGWKPNGRTL